MVSQFIYGLHPAALMGCVLTLSIGVALGCIFWCRYFVKVAHSEDAEFKMEAYSSAFGIAFAILLGHLIATAWESYDNTDDLLRSEVNYLEDLYKLSNYLEEGEKTDIRQKLKDYVNHVVQEEWPLLPHGKYSDDADKYIFSIYDAIYKKETTNKIESHVVTQMESILTSLTEKRRARNLNAHSSIIPIMWGILMTCCGIAFFILGLAIQCPLPFHMLLQTLYSVGIGIMFYLVIILDHPFYYGFYCGGEVSPKYFEKLLSEWDREEKTQTPS